MSDFKDIRKKFSMHVDLDAFIPATDEEKAYMVQMRPSSTFFRDGVKRLLKNKVATVSLIVIIIITLSSLFIPLFWPYAFGEQLGIQPGKPVDSSYGNLAPFEYGKTEQARIAAGEKVFPHIFGTDERGRDYFIRVVYGTRISLAVGFFASIIVLIIGMTIGSIAGYCGGTVDLVIMRIVDIIYSLPDMLMVILLASVLKKTLGSALEGTALERIGTNIISLFIVFGVLYWVSMSRLIRGQILYRAADPERDLHGELPVVPRSRRQRADAVAGLARFRCAERLEFVSVPHDHSGDRHFADRSVAEPVRRRSKRCV